MVHGPSLTLEASMQAVFPAEEQENKDIADSVMVMPRKVLK